jgi:hypothetical protein
MLIQDLLPRSSAQHAFTLTCSADLEMEGVWIASAITEREEYHVQLGYIPLPGIIHD